MPLHVPTLPADHPGYCLACGSDRVTLHGVRPTARDPRYPFGSPDWGISCQSCGHHVVGFYTEADARAAWRSVANVRADH